MPLQTPKRQLLAIALTVFSAWAAAASSSATLTVTAIVLPTHKDGAPGAVMTLVQGDGTKRELTERERARAVKDLADARRELAQDGKGAIQLRVDY